MRNGWVARKLGEVTTKIGSGATPLGGEESYKAEGTSFIRSLNVYDDGFREHRLARIDDTQAKRLSNVVVESNDVLLNITGASIARCCLAPADLLPARVNQHVSIIRPQKEKLDPAFLHYLLISNVYKCRLLNKGEEGGSTRQAITRAQLQDFTIDYPESLTEQKRIVGILDGTFEGIATAKANAERNLQNARALLTRELDRVFAQRGSGWVEKPFNELTVSTLIGLTRNSREQGADRAFPYVKMNNITPENRFDFSSFTCVDASTDELERFRLQSGDFLFNTRNSHELVGKSCVFEEVTGSVAIFNNNIMRVRFKCEVNPRFVLLAFASRRVANQLETLKNGTTNVSAIYYKDLKLLPIPIPAPEKQRAIVARLEELRVTATHLELIYRRKLAALEALKNSLLHQAFTRQL